MGIDTDRDVFVSYTKDDRDWAEWIAWELEEASYQVLIQAWDLVAGSNWVHGMHEGVQRAERTLAVLSSAYLRSVYGSAEWEAAWAADPLGQRRKLLTARAENCDRPGLLGQGRRHRPVRLQPRRGSAAAGGGEAGGDHRSGQADLAAPVPGRRLTLRSTAVPGDG